MAAPNFNRERAARMLVEQSLAGTPDGEFGKLHGVTAKTLYNWRQRLESDREFAELFRSLKAKAVAGWADDLAPAIKGAISFLKRASSECDPSSPDAVHSVAGALKILTTVSMTQQVLDARFAGQHRPAGSPTGEVASGEEGERPAVH